MTDYGIQVKPCVKFVFPSATMDHTSDTPKLFVSSQIMLAEVCGVRFPSKRADFTTNGT